MKSNDKDDLTQHLARKADIEKELYRLTPMCPYCDRKMKQCIANRSGKPFWGCPVFPHCSGFRGMRPRGAHRRRRLRAELAEVMRRIAETTTGGPDPADDT